MKTIFTINGNPVLDIVIREIPIDKPKNFGTNRRREKSSKWNEIWDTDMSLAKEVELTTELKQTLLEDLAYTYGQNTDKFTEKLKEFNLI